MNARLKTILLSALGAMTAFTAVTFSSCKPDKCKAIVCAYGGVCTGGGCLCPSGYEGPQCETINRERYLRTWAVTEDGTLTNATQYTISITPGDNITELRIKNFYNHFVTDVSAFVKGDTLYIPQQDVDNHSVMGVGYMKDDEFYGKHGTIVVKYKIIDHLTGITDDFGVDGGDPSLWNK